MDIDQLKAFAAIRQARMQKQRAENLYAHMSALEEKENAYDEQLRFTTFLADATGALETPADINALIEQAKELSPVQRMRVMRALIKHGASEEYVDDDTACFVISLLHAQGFPLPFDAILVAYQDALGRKWLSPKALRMSEFLLDLGAPGLDLAIEQARKCEFTKPWHLNALLSLRNAKSH